MDASITRRYGGTGLGLAISKGLVEAMGGFIDATGKLGVGARFWFEIRAPQVEGPNDDVPNLADHRVLVVSAVALRRQALSELLTMWGATVDAAPSFERANETHYAFVLTDRDAPPSSLGPVIGLRATRTPALGDISRPVQSHRLAAAIRRLQMPKPERRRPAELSPSPDLGLHVLLVDDQAINRKVGLHMVRRLGYSVDAADSGAEALAMVVERAYDIVLMDIHMPGMDGMACTRAIREALPSDRQPFIVALTADAALSDRAACLAAGMDGHLAKPVSLHKLEEALATLSRRDDASAPSEPAAPDDERPPGHAAAPTSDPQSLVD